MLFNTSKSYIGLVIPIPIFPEVKYKLLLISFPQKSLNVKLSLASIEK